MFCRNKEKSIIPEKEFSLFLSVKDLCCLWKIVGCADISISDFLQHIIEYIVHSYSASNDNQQLKRIIGTADKKTFLRFLQEQNILENAISNWEAMQKMKLEIQTAKRNKLRYPKKEVKEIKEYIAHWQKYFEDLYAKYILWSGEARPFEEEMEHVVSWTAEMLAFNRFVLLKKNVS